MDAVTSIAVLLFVYSLSGLIIGGFAFIKFRDVSPISNRSYIFSILNWLGLFAAVMQTFSNYFPVGDCFVQFVIWKSILPGPNIVYIVRCTGLYMAYNYYNVFMKKINVEEHRKTEVTKDMIDLMTEETRKHRIELQKINDKISIRFLLKMYIIMHACVQWSILLIDIIYVKAHGQDLSETCKNPIQTAGAVIQALLFIGAIIIFSWKLWNVHDAYYVKREMKIIGIAALVFGFPGFALTFAGNLKLVGYLCIMMVYCVLITATFLMPSLIALKTFLIEHKILSSTGSSKTFIEGVGRIASTELLPGSEEHIEKSLPDSNKLFSQRNDLNQLLFDDVGYKTVESFIIDCQNRQYGAGLKFLQAVTQYNLYSREAKGAHACLIFGRYIETDAYLYLQKIPDRERTRIAEIVKIIGANPEADIDLDGLFDESRQIIEAFLIEELFTPYLQSEFYPVYLKSKTMSRMA